VDACGIKNERNGPVEEGGSRRLKTQHAAQRA
jgi:hypothetical protein